MTQANPISLTSLDSVEITGRGRIYIVEINRSDYANLLGQTVILDGKLVTITAVSTPCFPTRNGDRVAIDVMVEPVKPYIQRRHFADLLHSQMAVNPDIWVLVADLGFKMWDEIARDYPDRFVNVGAAEQLLVGAGVGLALEGKLPICYSITPFLLYRPAELIRNYLDHEKINVKLVGAGNEGDYAHDSFSHHIFNVPQTMSLYPNISTYLPDKSAAALDADFPAFINDPKPSLMVLRK